MSYAPFTEDIVCQHQTLYPGTGIEIRGSEDFMGYRQAIGFMPIPLEIRYNSFKRRLSKAKRPQGIEHRV